MSLNMQETDPLLHQPVLLLREVKEKVKVVKGSAARS